MSPQPAILLPQHPFARYLTGYRRYGVGADEVIAALQSLQVSEECVVGLGPGLARFLGQTRTELRGFPQLTGHGIEVPSTQTDLWVWVNCDQPNSRILRTQQVQQQLDSCFEFSVHVDGFKNGETANGLGRDLTGYEDGTENPTGDAAAAAAIAADGSSFVAIQMWKHDLAYFASRTPEEQDLMIGRRRSDNEELDEAPESAHVKRTAQESFDPEAFVLRRSLPWSGPDGEGLMFVAFGKSFDAFEAQLRRMAGLDDGIIDACFQFSRPLTGGYYWCPPCDGSRLILN